ncbi:MAG: radical SAM protein [Candidatus Omnitrophota bacterium]|jgi:MoaA/NifB/PqqE/SkfB family radical SAM enzyme
MLQNEVTLQCIINDRCNNNCLFCIDKVNHSSTAKSPRQLHQLLKKGVRRTKNIIFTGPEPTVNDSLTEYIKTARAAGYSNIRLITNARRLSYIHYAKALLSSGITEIIVSLHGSTSKIHDALTRTKGSFEQTTKACGNLDILRQTNNFIWRINITLNAINASNLIDFYRLALGFKSVESIGVNCVIPAGNGLFFLNRLSPNYTFLAEAFKNSVTALKLDARSHRRVGIGIVGLPACVLRGFENLLGSFESILLSKNKNVRVERRNPKRIKGVSCEKCIYATICDGVWEPYIKRNGWVEFKPVIE